MEGYSELDDNTYEPLNWQREINWLIDYTKGKGWRTSIMKLAIIEDAYAIWMYRNLLCFDNDRYKHQTIENYRKYSL